MNELILGSLKYEIKVFGVMIIHIQGRIEDLEKKWPSEQIGKTKAKIIRN